MTSEAIRAMRQDAATLPRTIHWRDGPRIGEVTICFCKGAVFAKEPIICEECGGAVPTQEEWDRWDAKKRRRG